MPCPLRSNGLHSPAGTALLHDLGPVVTRQLAESVITVHYRPLDDLSITQEKTGLCERKTELKLNNVQQRSAAVPLVLFDNKHLLIGIMWRQKWQRVHCRHLAFEYEYYNPIKEILTRASAIRLLRSAVPPLFPTSSNVHSKSAHDATLMVSVVRGKAAAHISYTCVMVAGGIQ